jgi:hypothetical protein
MMSILYFLAAVGVLICGAVFLWLLSEAIAGNDELMLHYGNVLLVTVVGTATYLYWGWISVGIVLLVFGGIWTLGSLYRAKGIPG